MMGDGYWATGITVRYGYSGMNLYGWNAEDWPPPPGRRQMLAAQSRRLGWPPLYRTETEDA